VETPVGHTKSLKGKKIASYVGTEIFGPNEKKGMKKNPSA